MLPEIPQDEKEKMLKKVVHTLQTKGTKALLNMILLLMLENAKLLADANRLRAAAGEDLIQEHKL